jgi:predicted DNA-binding transcriptional regulator AlpA
MPSETSDFLTTKEVATQLGCCTSTVISLTKRRIDPLPCLKLGPELWKYPRRQLEVWIQNNSSKHLI